MAAEPLLPPTKKSKKVTAKGNHKRKKQSASSNGKLKESDWRLHPDFWAANDRFWEELPQLLADPHLFARLVVYTPERRVLDLVGDDDLELVRECDRRGMERGHYVVARVLPDLP